MTPPNHIQDESRAGPDGAFVRAAFLGAGLAFLSDSLGNLQVAALFYAALVAAAVWSGGRRYALPAAAAVAALVNLFLLTPLWLQASSRVLVLAGLAAFAAEGLLVSAMISALRGRRGEPAASSSAGRRAGLAAPEGSSRALTESSRQGRERFRALTDGLRNYAIFMLDPEGRVATWNAGAARLLGRAACDAVGRPYSCLYTDEDARDETPAADLAQAAALGHREVEGWRRRGDGSKLWANAGITAIRDDLGNLRGFATILCDLSERKRAEERLRQAQDELEERVRERTAELAEANRALRSEVAERRRVNEEVREAKEAAEFASRAKDRFMAVLSHELRTPLTPVLLAVSAALEEPARAIDVPAMMAMIKGNIDLEARLIDDLLDLTRATSGQFTLRRATVDAHEAIRQSAELCRAEVDAAGLRLAVEFQAADRFLSVDPARFQQVLWNLVKNAVKFTPAGGRVTIRTFNEGGGPAPQGDGRLVVEVADTGVGIDAHVLPKIFEAFEQGGDEVRKRYGGLGLGLAISRSAVEAHGGVLTARSAGRGTGTTLRLELATIPAPAVDAAPTAPATARPLPPSRNLAVLLVEDNHDTLRYLALVLERRGHKVWTAPNLEAARGLAEGRSFDLLISDIELPDGSGLTLMRELKGSQGLPGIAMSGFGSEEDVRLSLSAGFRRHLAKPVDVQTLDAAIFEATSDTEAACTATA